MPSLRAIDQLSADIDAVRRETQPTFRTPIDETP
jgi:hypothetical protein